MHHMRIFFMAVVFTLIIGPAFALATGIKYSADTFNDAQSADKSILIYVKADWCPTCKAQGVILKELQLDPGMQEVAFISVDYDKDKDFLKKYNISRQSTILVFDGEDEIGRSVAETNRDRLREFVFNSVEKASAPHNNNNSN